LRAKLGLPLLGRRHVSFRTGVPLFRSSEALCSTILKKRCCG
jgi:hypothetical protein